MAKVELRDQVSGAGRRVQAVKRLLGAALVKTLYQSQPSPFEGEGRKAKRVGMYPAKALE